MLKLYNSFTNKKEDFLPINKEHIKMYVCGPTVYDYIHIGNARSTIVFDVLYRLLRYLYPRVSYIQNITDIDDKIIKRAGDKKIDFRELVKKYLSFFKEDMDYINNLPPSNRPMASEHIKEMQEIISLLIKNNHAYELNGHVLFNTTSFTGYGDLSKKTEFLDGSRDIEKIEKNNPKDFVLWKPALKKDEPVWESPWGKGRPGWHLECSAMAHKYLGKSFDIHGGGQDLLFPHHENERAQSMCAFKDSKFAKYWLHNGYVQVMDKKMSKSMGNFTTIEQLKNHFSGNVIRFALLGTHYRSNLNFSNDLLKTSELIINKFSKAIFSGDNKINKNNNVPSEFINTLLDDLNVPAAITLIHRYIKEGKINEAYSSLDFIGIHLEAKKVNVDKELVELKIKERDIARSSKDFKKADAIKDELLKMSIELLDTPEGTKWRIK